MFMFVNFEPLKYNRTYEYPVMGPRNGNVSGLLINDLYPSLLCHPDAYNTWIIETGNMVTVVKLRFNM